MSTKHEKDSLGSRMKRYEDVTQIHLMKRTPAIIRIDGKAFHTFTKTITQNDPSMGNLPFSNIMHIAMVDATRHLVNNIQGCVLGYTQSDEISLLIRDWDTIETQAWFDYDIQKMVSVSASLAATSFNFSLSAQGAFDPRSFNQLAQMDSRVFSLPREEVANYFIWRQQDASRNSIQMVGHHHFSQRDMHGKNNSEVQDMLMLQKNINWNDIPTWMKRGSCVVREKLRVDDDIPIFTQDRNYIEQHLTVAEE